MRIRVLRKRGCRCASGQGGDEAAAHHQPQETDDEQRPDHPQQQHGPEAKLARLRGNLHAVLAQEREQIPVFHRGQRGVELLAEFPPLLVGVRGNLLPLAGDAVAMERGPLDIVVFDLLPEKHVIDGRADAAGGLPPKPQRREDEQQEDRQPARRKHRPLGLFGVPFAAWRFGVFRAFWLGSIGHVRAVS